MDDNCPAGLALRYAVNSSDLYRGRRGRPQTNLFSILVNDLKEHNIGLKNLDDLHLLRCFAYDRAGWRSLYKVRHFGD